MLSASHDKRKQIGALSGLLIKILILFIRVPEARLKDLQSSRHPFFCYLNPDLNRATCDIEEEVQDPNEVQLQEQ
jgi:hypothetical protein